MNARELTVALGGRWHGRYGTARCPAHNDRDPSLSIGESNGKSLVKCHSGCDQANVIAALEAQGLWDASRGPPPRKTEAPTSIKNRGRALTIWRETRPAPATLTDLWLTARGIRFAIPPTIRHHDSLEYRDGGAVIGRWPAMITRLDDPAGSFSAIARLWLAGTIDAGPTRKAPIAKPRMTLGPLGPMSEREGMRCYRAAIVDGRDPTEAVLECAGVRCCRLCGMAIESIGDDGCPVETAMDRDRAWFEAHPNEREYIRPFSPGELPIHPPADLVRVVCVGPGLRVRVPLYFPSCLGRQ